MSVVRDRARDHLDRRQATRREDQLLRERAGGLLDLVGAIVDRDRLEQHQPVRREQLRAGAEEDVEVLPADRLDHLDRDELRVAPAQVAVVLDQHLDAVFEAGRAHALARHGVLLCRDRGGGHAAAVLPGGMDGERAPAAADLDEMVVGAQLELAADPVELRELGLVQRHPRLLEQRARVGHRLVEEEPEHVVAEVVVRRDVAACPSPRVARHSAERAHAGARTDGAAGRGAAPRARRCGPR